MGRSIRVPDHIDLLIRHLPPDLKKKIRRAFDEIAEKPAVGKNLSEELVGLQSYKLGRMRIIYKVEGTGSIRIVSIGPRRTVYQKTAIELGKKS